MEVRIKQSIYDIKNFDIPFAYLTISLISSINKVYCFFFFFKFTMQKTIELFTFLIFHSSIVLTVTHITD